DSAFLADAGEHVGERTTLRDVVMHVVDRDQRRAHPRAERVEQAEAAWLVTAIAMHAGKEAAPGRRSRERREPLGERRRKLLGRQRDQHLAFTDSQNVLEAEPAFAFLALAHLAIALAQQAAKPAIG